MQRGRKLTFSAIKSMEGMPVLVHDLEYDIYDQLCYVEFEVVPLTSKTKEYTKFPTAKGKRRRKSITNQADLGIRKINLVNEEITFTYDWLGRCINGEFECYAPVCEEGEIKHNA